MLIFIRTIDANITMIPIYPTKLICSFSKNTPATVATTTSTEATMVVFEASIPMDSPAKNKIFANVPLSTAPVTAQNKNVPFVKKFRCSQGLSKYSSSD